MQTQSEDLTGHLLIAMPGMEDPRFARSVVYLCAYSEDGAMGLILNKPTPEVRFSDLLEQLDISRDAGAPDLRIHYGGPVETGRGFVLHTSDYASEQGTMQVSETVAMTATVDVLDALVHGAGPARSLMALGYSGWGPGQLEDEIAMNGWLTVKATDDLVFGRAHDHKWAAALRLLGVDPLNLSDQAGHA